MNAVGILVDLNAARGNVLAFFFVVVKGFSSRAFAPASCAVEIKWALSWNIHARVSLGTPSLAGYEGLAATASIVLGATWRNLDAGLGV